MTIIGSEYKRGAMTMFIWSLVCCFIVAVSVLVFYMSQDAGIDVVLGRVTERLSEVVLDFFRLNDLSILRDFENYITYIYRPILVLSCFYSARLGLASMSTEEKKRTIEFLYSFPVSRFQMVLQKIIGTQLLFLTFCTILGGFTFGITVLAIRGLVLTELVLKVAFLVCSLFLSGFVYCLIGFLISSKPKTLRSPSFVAIVLVILGITINILTEYVESLKILSYISPYSYATPLNISGTPTPILHYVLAVGLSLFCIGFTLIFQRNRSFVSE